MTCHTKENEVMDVHSGESSFRPISHCREYSRRTFVASTRSEYSEPVSKKLILIIDSLPLVQLLT